MEDVRKPKPSVKVALVGKYVELQDAYMSVREALKHAALANGVEVEIGWVHSADLEKDKGWDVVKAGGCDPRARRISAHAASKARFWRRVMRAKTKSRISGLCLGMQVMCIDFARNVLGLEDANSSEFDRGTEHPVIDLMIDQRSITDMGGTMRLGLYPCAAPTRDEGRRRLRQSQVDERHRHRFEFNNAYRAEFEKHGMVFSGISPDGKLVEIVELADHPYMVGKSIPP